MLLVMAGLMLVGVGTFLAALLALRLKMSAPIPIAAQTVWPLRHHP